MVVDQIDQHCVRAALVLVARSAASARQAAIAVVAQDPMFRFVEETAAHFGRGILAKAGQSVGLGHEPPQFGRGGRLQRILQHRLSEVEPRAQKPDEHIGLLAQIVQQGRRNIDLPDPLLLQLLAIAVLAQVGLAAKQARAPLDPFEEWILLEGVERVVVDKDRNRPLCRQVVGRMVDAMRQ
jgi:hypothetical protein